MTKPLLRVDDKTYEEMNELRRRIGMTWATFLHWLWANGADQLKAAAEKLEKRGSK